MVQSSQIDGLQPLLASLLRLLKILETGGYVNPITDAFTTLTPAQVTNLTNRANTILSNLQARINTLSPS